MNTININVSDYLPKVNKSERVFVLPKGINKRASAYRYSVVDRLINEWFREINSEEADTRGIPVELADMYEEAYKLMVDISIYEKKMIVGD